VSINVKRCFENSYRHTSPLEGASATDEPKESLRLCSGQRKKGGRPPGRKSQKTMLFPNFASQTKDFLKSLSI